VLQSPSESVITSRYFTVDSIVDIGSHSSLSNKHYFPWKCLKDKLHRCRHTWIFTTVNVRFTVCLSPLPRSETATVRTNHNYYPIPNPIPNVKRTFIFRTMLTMQLIAVKRSRNIATSVTYTVHAFSRKIDLTYSSYHFTPTEWQKRPTGVTCVTWIHLALDD